VHHHIENVIVIEITGGWYTENISNELITKNKDQYIAKNGIRQFWLSI